MRPEFGEPVTDWRPYFAWVPILTWDKGWRWLCWVERRLINPHHYLSGPLDDWFQYRARGSDGIRKDDNR